MRVLSLLWGFSLGGVSKYATSLNQINGLNENQLELVTVCIYSPGWGCCLSPLEQIGAHFVPIHGRTDFSWISRTSELIDSLKPDILLVHGFNGPVVAQICSYRTEHTFDFVSTYHGPYSAPKPSRRMLVPILNYLQEWLYRKKSRAVLSVCDYSRRYLVKKGVPPSKVTTVHNGILPDPPVTEIIGLRSELGYTPSNFLVGVASRLDPIKGIDYLIEAFTDVIKAVPHAKLVIFGTGACKSELMELAAQRGLAEYIEFAGYSAHVDRLMAAFDVFVLPSLAEFHSIGLLEAMRAGLTIVATDVGGNPESVVDGVSGLIVPSRDSSSLAKAIITCARDEKLSKKLGEQARLRFEAKFTLDKQLRATADWLSRFAD